MGIFSWEYCKNNEHNQKRWTSQGDRAAEESELVCRSEPFILGSSQESCTRVYSSAKRTPQAAELSLRVGEKLIYLRSYLKLGTLGAGSKFYLYIAYTCTWR